MSFSRLQKVQNGDSSLLHLLTHTLLSFISFKSLKLNSAIPMSYTLFWTHTFFHIYPFKMLNICLHLFSGPIFEIFYQ